MWGKLVCGTGRRTSHLAAISWERLSSLVFAVSLSITATASCFSSLFGAGQGVPFPSSSFHTFCSSLLLSFPLFLRLHITHFHPSRLLLTLWALLPSRRLFLFYTLAFPPFILPTLLTTRHPADSLSWQPRWRRARGCGWMYGTKLPPPPPTLPPFQPSHWADPLVLHGAPWSSTTTHINLLNDPGPKRINTHFQGAAWSLNVVEDGCLSLTLSPLLTSVSTPHRKSRSQPLIVFHGPF